MKKYLLISSFLLISIIVSGCSKKSTIDTNKLNVVSTIPSLYSMTYNVTEDLTNLENIIPVGASPHEYALTPSDITTIASADVIITTGLGADSFLNEAIEESSKSDVLIIDVSEGLELITSEHIHEHEHDDKEVHEEHNDLEVDGHIWLSLENAKTITTTIATNLKTIDPDNASQYQANAKTYISEIENLQTQAQTSFSDITSHEFIALHPAWLYFAKEFELEQIDSIELTPGQEPSAKEIAELIDAIETHNIQALFYEPQLPEGTVNTLHNDTGLPLYEIDPLGQELSKNSYLDTMKSNVDTFTRALQ